jgi:VIT1/CCC1 family predicted Fe2+/Mn2+ transporter
MRVPFVLLMIPLALAVVLIVAGVAAAVCLAIRGDRSDRDD